MREEKERWARDNFRWSHKIILSMCARVRISRFIHAVRVDPLLRTRARNVICEIQIALSFRRTSRDDVAIGASQ